jgi:CheY-like chemotaxis protein
VAGPVILVVDDNHDNAEVLRQLLLTRGYSVVVAHDGDDAMRQFEAARPVLVLLDVIMPGRNGWEVCRSMKQHPVFGSRVRVVMVTGLDDAVTHQEAARAGADAIIEKPIHFKSMLETVARLVSSE